MRRDNPGIIADRSQDQADRRLTYVIFASALVIGGLAAGFYASRDLTLSHYDARAHIMVARRLSTASRRAGARSVRSGFPFRTWSLRPWCCLIGVTARERCRPRSLSWSAPVVWP
jgi:hypothetical protein